MLGAGVCVQSSDPESSGELTRKLYPMKQRRLSLDGTVSVSSICPLTYSVVTKLGMLKGPPPTLEASYVKEKKETLEARTKHHGSKDDFWSRDYRELPEKEALGMSDGMSRVRGPGVGDGTSSRV